MGNRTISANELASQICEGIDPEMLNSSGSEIYKKYEEKVQFPYIGIFNQYRLSPYIKKFWFVKSQRQEIRQLIDHLNSITQAKFEKKWQQMQK